MKKSLEFKILAIVTALLVVGVASASFMAMSIQKKTLYSVTEFGTEKTANIIFLNIEATMLEGKADVTEEIIEKIGKMRGIENITVLNAEGRQAFRKGSPATEAAALDELKSGKDRLLKSDRSQVTFFLPLRNVQSCQACHSADLPLLGAVKVSVSIKKEYEKAMALIFIVIGITIAAALCFSAVLWVLLRRMVIKPIKSLEAAAVMIAEGDLSFNVESKSDDEIGRVILLFRESFMALQGILQRIKELSDRILKVVGEVGKEAENVLKGAAAETEATANISSSMQELNATTADIADNTGDLAASAEEASASIEQMLSSIKYINESIQELNGIVGSTSASIEQLSATIKEVTGSSEELDGASGETVAAISEITATIREVETNARESAMLSEKVMSDAGTLGMESIAKTMEGMKEIELSVSNTGRCISALGSRSKDIEKILSVIQSVNDETYLLALNAAILASKAGEHGRGFSVVATEMKDLSERTGNSTEEIASLIRAVQQEVRSAETAMKQGTISVAAGLKLTKETEEALKKILAGAKESSEMTLSIKRSTGEQAKAAGQVMEVTERVKAMIDNIARAMAEQSRGVVLITEAAGEMGVLSNRVSKAAGEQAASSGHIAQITEMVHDKSRQISKSLSEHKQGSGNILDSIEAVKDIPAENRKMAIRISNSLWNLQKDAELLKVEMERFRFSVKRGHALRFGVVPLQDPSAMFRKFKPLAEYLGRKLGKKIDLNVAVDMENAVKDIGENVTQLCAMGPANYIDANMNYGVKVIAKALRQGKPFHRAAIVTRADSGLRSLKDLRGKTLALVSRKSATGHVMPLATLKDAGITINDLKYYEFLGDHDKVVLAVLNGDYDAGGVMEEAANKLKDKGLVVLQLSLEIPEFNICFNPSVDAETVNVIKDALVALDISNKDEATILKSLGKDCTGFVPATESDYTVFREKIRGIEADLDLGDHYHKLHGSGKDHE